jgi:DNA-binding SARP family transcriptional activator
MDHLTLSFFGAFQATLGDKPLTNFRSAKVQGLLIYLVLTRQQAHARDVLATLFWPDEAEAIAKQNLRQSLHRLRQIVGDTASPDEPHLLVTRSTVQFNGASAYSLDVTDFLTYLEKDRLEPAVNLYQGELLPGFTCESLPFDEWLRSEREQLHRLAQDGLFKLTAHNLAQADYRTARRLARQQLALEPWREEAHRQLIQALALQGERSAALAQYETCRDVLAEELGVEPATETAALVAQIRAQRPERKVRHNSRHSLERRWLTMPFVGRSREYEALVDAYQRASSDGVQVVTLVGKAGIGKTRLAQQFLEWAAMQGADVLRGWAFETSGGLSYQPLTQLLRQRLERENAPDDLLSDLWLTQLTRILPELRDRYPDLPEPTQEEATARQHLFEAITRLGQALAERAPLVLSIDDWHWADTASLDVLHYASLRWLEERVPILVLLTLRQEALLESSNMQSWLTRLKRDAAPLQLNLGELSRTETKQLIRGLIEPSESDDDASLTQFSHWLFSETEGQPLFLTETLKALVEDGLIQPDTTAAGWRIDWATLNESGLESRILPGVREIVRGWLDRITAPAGELLTAASVLAEEASFNHLCQVAGLEEIRVMEALDELLSRQLLLETDEALSTFGRDPIYTFSHQKVSEVVYTEAGAARRRILHRRAFETLQASAAPPAEVAHHAHQAGLWAETIRYSLLAGHEAMDLFAVRVAITHYETVWRLVKQQNWPREISGADRQILYADLGRAYELVENWPQAQEIYQAMIDYAKANGIPTMECLGLNRLATIYINGMKDQQQAMLLLERAKAIAEEEEDKLGLAETEWSLLLAARLEEDSYRALDHGEKALALARHLGHRQLMARCLSELSYVYIQLRRWETVEHYANEARQLYAAAGNRVLEADSQRVAAWGQILTGRPKESLTTLQETLAFSQQIENMWGEADAARVLAYARMELGHYSQAFKLAQQAVEQTRLVGHPLMIDLAQITWAVVQRMILALTSARQTLLTLWEDFTKHDFIIDWALAELCAVYAITGDWDRAHGYARQRVQRRRDETLLPLSLSGWSEIEALLRGGDDALARAEVERLAELVSDNRRYRLPLLRSQAVLAQWDGDLDQAISHLQAALTLAQEIGLSGEAWPIWGALGGLYAERGDSAKAQQAYHQSAAIILRLAETIDEEDLRAGFLAAEQVRSILVLSEAV